MYTWYSMYTVDCVIEIVYLCQIHVEQIKTFQKEILFIQAIMVFPKYHLIFLQYCITLFKVNLR